MQWRRLRRPVTAIAILAARVALPAAAAQGPAKLIRLTFCHPVRVAGPLAKGIGEMTDRFNKEHPGIEVVPVYSGDYDPTLQKVQTAVMAGNPPDVFLGEISELPTLLAMNAIIPLDDYVKKAEGGKHGEDFFPAFRDNSVMRGRIWWVLFQRSTPVLSWNKDAFQQAGLDPEKSPQTWSELREMAKTHTVREGNEGKQWGVTISGGLERLALRGLRPPERVVADQSRGHPGRLRLERGRGGAGVLGGVDAPREGGAAPLDLGLHAAGFRGGPPGHALSLHGHPDLPQDLGEVRLRRGLHAREQNLRGGDGGGNFAIARKIPKERQAAAWKFGEGMTSAENAAQWSIASGYIATRQSSYTLPAMKEFVARIRATRWRASSSSTPRAR
jgi:sn-glycerol 3-phosphate transport system substrate-binding protein